MRLFVFKASTPIDQHQAKILQAVRHLVCGGYYVGDDSQISQAGQGVCMLFEEAQFRALIGASKLQCTGMPFMPHKTAHNNYFHLASRVHLKHKPVVWDVTLAH